MYQAFVNDVLDELNAKLVAGAVQKLEKILGKSEFIVGNQLTEADVRAFTTLIRYHSL